MEKTSNSVDRKMRGEFLLLNLGTINTKFSFIRVKFQFTLSVIYCCSSSREVFSLENAAEAFFEKDGHVIGCRLHKKEILYLDECQ